MTEPSSTSAPADPLLQVCSNGGLGPLPERAAFEAWATDQGLSVETRGGMGGGVAYRDLRTHGAWEGFCVGAAAERERCAAWVDSRREDYCAEHGLFDPDTGALEFGRGQHAEAKSEYVAELEEIATGLRNLKA